MRGLMIGLVAGVMGLGGCTAVKVERLHPCKVKKVGDLPGVVYYEPEPFLQVIVSPKRDKENGNVVGYETKADVVYLPNKNKPYAINSDRTGAQNNLQLTLKDGWMLVSVNGTSDPQIDEGIKSIAEVVGSVTALLDEAASPDHVRVFMSQISMDRHGKITFGDAVEFPIP